MKTKEELLKEVRQTAERYIASLPKWKQEYLEKYFEQTKEQMKAVTQWANDRYV